MRKSVAVAGLVVLLAACGGGGPITIMPIGDSITSGETGWSTYRCYLHGMLTDAGVSFDFVGTMSDPYPVGPYGCPSEFDQDHEGYWGWRVDQVMDEVATNADTLQPDVALIHLGTNDLYANQGPATTVEELESLIVRLQGLRSDITILVAQVIPCTSPRDFCSEEIPVLNDAIVSLADLSTESSPIIVVDMETGFSADHLRDPYHPTDAGDEFIARRWMDALEESGVLLPSS